ncbi:MED6-domain-containing protein [Annulohypoxylon truncatum]|uniref:MED6-domain-containing protein n=1 Tax=Annulohypoxylon truncatum TaxID=327061 RepID=UPI0020078145|nr:MED6-domain-containing protein [Annulohypoxylon truncatum]KAI1214816.1 MED6-domain-containing protein [Annulohypoxylon truncatum]
MAAPKEIPLDEIQWHDPFEIQRIGGLHSNTVLFYFASSPFFDGTSNNAIVYNQAVHNENMNHLIHTREAFEGRLREMTGLEFMVAQEPAESGPGMGTGVWVIHKQTRRKREPKDEIIVHAAYYLVGDHIYMAPSFSDIVNHTMITITEKLSKCFAIADKARTWSPSTGHGYNTASATTSAKAHALESKGTTPMPNTQESSTSEAKKPTRSAVDSRLAEHSFMIHMQYGGEYMDENPITGKPGEFHLSSTGRKDKMPTLALPSLNTTMVSSSLTQPDKKDAKAGEKTPKTPTGMSKIKRKKSKAGATPTSA